MLWPFFACCLFGPFWETDFYNSAGFFIWRFSKITWHAIKLPRKYNKPCKCIFKIILKFLLNLLILTLFSVRKFQRYSWWSEENRGKLRKCGKLDVFCGKLDIFCGLMNVFCAKLDVFCGKLVFFAVWWMSSAASWMFSAVSWMLR